ncbi:MFS transporter [Bifidobacterium sp. SO1]|uniref:MDR family MFS transporter n=1 Tax=Bifidobacterium sp. SO1 TaxID=2809029 RepID=UPI001BDDA3EA|nr:MFS transporter [Bifidobacterium sp. SO1]MBT1162588.1 MFS transporter [Bifidobacterium sp. SO1]
MTRRNIFGLPLLFWGLWLALLILWMGRFVISFMSMYLVKDLHVDAGVAGTIVSMYGFGGIFGCLFGGSLSDRFGRQSMIISGEIGAAIMLIILSFIDDPFVMGAMLLVYGAISSIPTPAIAAYIADVVPMRAQKRAYTLQTWAVNFGFAIGPIIANQLVKISYTLMFYAEAVILVVATVMLIVFFHEARKLAGRGAAADVISSDGEAEVEKSSPSPAASASEDLSAPLRSGRDDRGEGRSDQSAEQPVSMLDNYRRALTDWPFMSMVVFMFCYTIAYFQLTSGLPIALTQLGMGTDQYSVLLTINGGMLCLLQIPSLAVFNRMSNTRVLVLGMLMTAVGYAFQIGATTWHGFAIAAVLWTLGELGTFPIAATTVANLAPANARGTYQGLYNLVWSLSNGAAPLVGGWMISRFGSRTLWICCTAMFLLVAAGFAATKGARERAVARNLREADLIG